jgi:hypothetical protein
MGFPSTRTVQAPQLPVSQPFLTSTWARALRTSASMSPRLEGKALGRAGDDDGRVHARASSRARRTRTGQIPRRYSELAR